MRCDMPSALAAPMWRQVGTAELLIARAVLERRTQVASSSPFTGTCARSSLRWRSTLARLRSTTELRPHEGWEGYQRQAGLQARDHSGPAEWRPRPAAPPGWLIVHESTFVRRT